MENVISYREFNLEKYNEYDFLYLVFNRGFI